MPKIFDSVRVQKPTYSKFDLSHDHKLSLKQGKLVPVMCMEVVPGDNIKISSQAMFRMMPMIAPVMDRIEASFHHFYVPTRILWPNAERFFAGNEDGEPLPAPPAPPILDRDQSYVIDPSSLANYLGLPVGSISGQPLGTPISALPFAAYKRIFHEYYRDENLDKQAKIVLQDGEQSAGISNNLLQLEERAWEHDYFTSALPWAQKGNAVAMPLELTGDVLVKSYTDTNPGGGQKQQIRDWATGNLSGANILGTDAAGSLENSTLGTEVSLDPNGDLYVDKDDFFSQATVEDFRTAMTLQRWLETAARVGSRFVEFLRGFWNVKSSDARLDRPEYLGGSTSKFAISEVLQTGETGTTPQGTMAGHGFSLNAGNDINHYCEEYGFILTILSIKPRTSYYQGIPRMFSRVIDKFSYPYPQFMHLGEQEILSKEVYWDDADPVADNDAVFGYIPRYSEYRYMPGRVSGQMATTLEFWQAGRKFSTRPALNDLFVKADPTKRYFAVDDPDEDEIVGHVLINILARRPFPKYGTPGGL